MNRVFLKHAYLPQGWCDNVLVEIGDDGKILSVAKDRIADNIPVIDGYTIPGMPNLHSHCFQHLAAGLIEKSSNNKQNDDFWSWRETMYKIIAEISPEALEAISAYLYVEMMKRGFTSVAEFHYLHNTKNGHDYVKSSEMSDRIIAASKKTGMGLCLLPVLYAHSGFGGQNPVVGQQRFVKDTRHYLRLVEQLIRDTDKDNNVKIGIAPHSLRAVTKDELVELVDFAKDKSNLPIHIHIAEQLKEVEEAIKYLGMRPVHWLYHNFDIDSRWTLIHATHINQKELDLILNSSATVGLCPITEANLGDGVFPVLEYQSEEGAYGIGTDMNISTCVASELRLLEYGQRLFRKKRNILANGSYKSTGETIFTRALCGGAQALRMGAGAIQKGYRADFVVLDEQSPNFIGKKMQDVFDSWIFTGNYNPVKDVYVNGKLVIKNNRHKDEEKIYSNFKNVMESILYSLEL
jgi:formimidoylglutamate deiminase